VGARYAVAVTSGTAALHLMYLALGVGPGDVVATSPLTFLATANAAIYCGGRPEFVDVDPATACLDPDTLEESLSRGFRPKLVVPVHFGGLPCDLERLFCLAEEYGFQLAEDACHALGARYRLGDTWGAIGDCRVSRAAAFSFHPVKHITTGEGGAVVTNDGFCLPSQSRGDRGEERPWYFEMQSLGFNYRITDIQCALGLNQLRRFDRFVRRRKRLAQRYTERLAALEHRGALRRPTGHGKAQSAWHLYPVRIPEVRDSTHLELRDQGIGSQVHYIPVHLHPYYRDRFGTAPGDCPNAEGFFAEGLSLPLFPAMKDRDVDRVAVALGQILRRGALENGHCHTSPARLHAASGKGVAESG
jgi:dTDP-4-amino-4,6-dideoxygalactose transaminase